MKKVIAFFLICALLTCLVACGSARPESSPSETTDTSSGQVPSADNNAESKDENVENQEQTADTIGGVYLSAFKNSTAVSADEAAHELAVINAAGTELVEMEVSEGYLDGFDAEISGFSKGVKFSPMIGAIPFVGYVFETDKPDDLLNTLSEHFDLAWNICTEADEQVSAIRGNLVFFLMCTNEDF